jgi:amidase
VLQVHDLIISTGHEHCRGFHREFAASLDHGLISVVELAAKHHHRIPQYDRRGPLFNAIPIVNTDIFEAAQASDERRAAGKVTSGLDGVPYTIKDSYKIKGMTSIWIARFPKFGSH